VTNFELPGEARGVLDHTKSGDNTKLTPGDGGSNSASPRSSPKFGKRMLNMFRRGEEVGAFSLKHKDLFCLLLTWPF
jgi:hypothetical protein